MEVKAKQRRKVVVESVISVLVRIDNSFQDSADSQKSGRVNVLTRLADSMEEAMSISRTGNNSKVKHLLKISRALIEKWMWSSNRSNGGLVANQERAQELKVDSRLAFVETDKVLHSLRKLKRSPEFQLKLGHIANLLEKARGGF